MSKQKMKAFTLTEMIIVMLIVAILVGMAFSVFRVVSKTYLSFERRNRLLHEADRLNRWLERDMDRSAQCLEGKETLTFLMEGDTVQYHFTDSAVMRLAIRSDTFRFYTTDRRFTFQRDTLHAPVIEDTLYLVDRVAFALRLDGRKIHRTYQKKYSAQQLIQINNAIDRHQ